VQHLVESALDRWFTIALQVQGIATKVEFRFAELRASEEMRDEQTLSQRITNQTTMRNEGWITNDDASIAVTGHEAVAEAPEPEPIAPTNPDEDEDLDQSDVKADPGADRAVLRNLLHELRMVRQILNPNIPVEELAA